MNVIILGGWILIIGSYSGGSIVVVPTRYESKQDCTDAAAEAAKGFSASIGWSCLRAGQARGEIR